MTCVARGLAPHGTGSLCRRGGGTTGEAGGKAVAPTQRSAAARASARVGTQGRWMEAEPTDAERLLHAVRER
jgi:hypothetical protein